MTSDALRRRTALREAVSAVLTEIAAMKKGQVDWRSLKEQTLWYELVACVLGSGVRFEDAICAVTRLKRAGVLTWDLRPRSLPEFETRVARVLFARCSRRDGCIGRYRFPRRRAQLVRMAASAIYSSGESLRALLRAARSSQHARRVLVTAVPGIGPKQASLFLRNVGFAHDLAVLDVHVLRYLCWMDGVSRQRTVSGLREYERHERRIRRYAREASVTVGDLDLAVWITSRVAVSEGMK
jgi:N-glycosylase/DNA lyase